MSETLYEQFSHAVMALPAHELPLALDYVETVFLRASRDHGPDAMFPRYIERELPADRLFHVFEGRTLGEVAEVMSKLRHELADELARHGAPEDAVRELREGRRRPDGRRGETA
jgi:hypothetical protein